MKAHRDIFIDALRGQAASDERIVMISVDMGAPALDQWRDELPEQFISAGISEQNAVNVAAGLADAGKIPVVYFMAVWVARCYEQIRYSCAMPALPVTILGNGVGLGYAPAGPAHEPTEDIALMRSLHGLEIWSPSTSDQVEALAHVTARVPRLRYVRLERAMPRSVASLISTEDGQRDANGLEAVRPIYESGQNSSVLVLSCGYMLGRAIALAQHLERSGESVRVLDIQRLKPLDGGNILKWLNGVRHVVTLEEQFLDGGFGSLILELLAEEQLRPKVTRIGLEGGFVFENGSREWLLDQRGLSIERIAEVVESRSVR